MYKIKLKHFEGPLDLLISLIEDQKMDITQVSLSAVADQYLEYIKEQENVSIENLTHFLSVASRLILIKSKTLLPLLKLSHEEEEEIKDLEQQLKEFKKFKEVSQKIGKLFISSNESFSREGFLETGYFFCPPENINVFDLKKSFLKILDEIPISEKLEEEMVKEIVTLEEKIIYLQETLKKKVESSFSEIVSDSKDKIEVIVYFLAMLELIKIRVLEANQQNLFEDIKLSVKQYGNGNRKIEINN